MSLRCFCYLADLTKKHNSIGGAVFHSTSLACSLLQTKQHFPNTEHFRSIHDYMIRPFQLTSLPLQPLSSISQSHNGDENHNLWRNSDVTSRKAGYALA